MLQKSASATSHLRAVQETANGLKLASTSRLNIIVCDFGAEVIIVAGACSFSRTVSLRLFCRSENSPLTRR